MIYYLSEIKEVWFTLINCLMTYFFESVAYDNTELILASASFFSVFKVNFIAFQPVSVTSYYGR